MRGIVCNACPSRDIGGFRWRDARIAHPPERPRLGEILAAERRQGNCRRRLNRMREGRNSFNLEKKKKINSKLVCF